MLVGELTLIKCIGKGAFGEVYLTSKQGCKEKFATKKMDKKYASQPKVKKYFDNEINILKEVNHPHIVKLVDVQETVQCYYLVFELCNGGGLSDCSEKYQAKYKKPFTEEIVQYLMKQIVDVIKYLHGKGILHRDLKLDNILVNFESENDQKNLNMMKASVKVIDFGFARHLQPGELAKSTLGSPINMDPGILKKLNKMKNFMDYGYDEKADIWSLGTLCYELLTGNCTFDAENMKQLVQKIERGDYFLPVNISKEAVSFLNGMLQYDLKRRLSAEELSRHHFLTKNFTELTPINVKEVSKKIVKNEIKINSKSNESIRVMFDTKGPIQVIDSQDMLEPPNPDSKINNYIEQINKGIGDINLENSPKIIAPTPLPPKEKNMDEETLKKEFIKAFEIMNSDFIYIEPRLIPIIPGDDPEVINRASEFSEDNF